MPKLYTLMIEDPLVWAVAGLGALGAVAALVLFVLALRGRRVPGALWALPAALVAVLGLGASWIELGVVLGSMEPLHSTLVVSMLAIGAGRALGPALVGCGLASVLALGAALLLGIALLLRPGADTRWSLGHALFPALIGAVGAPLLARSAGPLAAVVALIGVLPCVLGALRCARREARSSPGARRLAAGRLAIALLAPLGALALAQALRIDSARRLFEIVGYQSSRLELLATAWWVHATPATILAALLVAMAGAAIVVPVARGSWDRRAFRGAAAFLIVAALPLLPRARLVEGLAEARDAARPWYEDRARQLAGEGLELPTSSSLRTPQDMLALSVTPDWLAVDGRRLERADALRDGMHWSLFQDLDEQAAAQQRVGGGLVGFRGSIRLQLHRDLVWGDLEPLLRAAAGARFTEARVAVVNPDGELGVIALSLGGEPHALAGTTPAPERTEPPGDGERFVELLLPREGPAEPPRVRLEALDGAWRLSAPGMEPELSSDPSSLEAGVRRIKDEYPDDEDLLVLPDGATRWQDLILALDALRGESWADALFPYPHLDLSQRTSEEAPE